MSDPPVEIFITGIDELLARYQVSDQVATQLLVDAMGNALDYVAHDAEIYPPESEANAPPPPYYIRGTGTQYANGGNRQESEQLGQNWKEEISLETDGILGTVKNNTSYAPFVHDPNRQMWFHKDRKWRTTVQIVDDVKDKVQEYFHLATAQLVAFLNGG